MADRITINFTAETRDVERGADRMADSLKDTEDALDDVGKAGEQAGEDASRGLDDAGESAEGVGGKLSGLGDIAKDALEGDFAGAAESAAGALELIGPIGAAAGAAAVVGISLITAEMNRQEEAAQRVRERFSGLYSQAIQEGRDFIDESQILKEALDLQWNTDRVDEYKQVQEDARVLGLDLGTAIRANAGDQEALNEVIRVTSQRYEEVSEKRQNLGTGPNAEVTDLVAQQVELDGIKGRYDGILGVQEEYADQVKISKDLIADSNAEQERGQAIDRARVDALQQDKEALSAPVVIQVTADDTEFQKTVAAIRRTRIDVGVRVAKNGVEALR